ncbi:STAS domain-containing protein [Endozoicomonadaceae bacterium StTr2]
MPFENKAEGDWTVVKVTDMRLDAAQAEPFRKHVLTEIDAGQSQFVIDLESVIFMDSSGLGALVACLKQLGGQGEVRLAGAGGAVKDLFELTSMDKLFKMFDNVEAALAGDGA